jgi:hypothetical protein
MRMVSLDSFVNRQTVMSETMQAIKLKSLVVVISLLFFSGTASAATGSATATVVTVRPLTLVKTDDLDFGSLIPSARAGTVIINPTTDARTATGGVTVAGGSPSAAKFVALGLLNIYSNVTLPTSITLARNGGGASMTVSAITTNGPAARVFPGTSILDVRIGGTLNVAANQQAGDYSGQFSVTVVYF